MIATQIGNQCN